MKTLTASGNALAHLRRALHVEVEQQVDAVRAARGRTPRARCRRARRAPPPTPGTASVAHVLERRRGRRSGSRTPSVSPARGGARGVRDGEAQVAPSPRSTRARTVDLPAPEGAGHHDQAGQRGHSTFCTCSRRRSISVLSATTSCTTSADTALLPIVFASRASSWARKSRRLPAGPRRLAGPAAPGPRGCAAAAAPPSTSWRSTSAHDLLVEPRVVERRAPGRQRADLLEQGVAARGLARLRERASMPRRRRVDGGERRPRGPAAGARPRRRACRRGRPAPAPTTASSSRRALVVQAVRGASTHLQRAREARDVGDRDLAREAVLGLHLAQRAHQPADERPRSDHDRLRVAR